MANIREQLSLEEHGLFLLIKKSGKCDSKIMDLALKKKTELLTQGRNVGLDKILLNSGSISPTHLGELIPEVKKIVKKTTACDECLRPTFTILKKCVFCQAEVSVVKLKLAPDPFESSTPGCPKCKVQTWAQGKYCENCGTDFQSGLPGPDSRCCDSCNNILLPDEAICTECGSWAKPAKKKRQSSNEDTFMMVHGGKLVFLLVILGCLFFWREPISGLISGDQQAEEKTSADASKLVTNQLQLEKGRSDENHWMQANQATRGNRFDQALEHLEKMSESPEVLKMRAYCHFRLALMAQKEGQLEKAKSHLEASQKLDPELLSKMRAKLGNS